MSTTFDVIDAISGQILGGGWDRRTAEDIAAGTPGTLAIPTAPILYGV